MDQRSNKQYWNYNELWKDRWRQKERLRSSFKPGDLVLIRNFNRRKLDPYLLGLLKIIK